MKPQDIIFFVVLLFLVFKRSSKLFVYAGMLCIVIAVPLFAKWIFFTAEHLVWYAAAFFLCAIIFSLFRVK